MPDLSSRAIAYQRFRDADAWQLAFDLSAVRYQGYVMLWLTLRCAYSTCMRGRRIQADRLRQLARRIDEVHDFAIAEYDNMRAAARNSRSAELAGRIYYEEYEEGGGT